MFSDKQLIDHHAFIIKTDRKSLYTQIKSLVERAQNVANGELENRRKALQKLLEYEDKIYEEEFANKVKSRIGEDIRERKNALIKIKKESDRSELQFLEKKRIHQNMDSCYEIRQALRHRDLLDVKVCQLQQIEEKERAIRRQRDLNEYWHKVEQINKERADRQHEYEASLKKAIHQQLKVCLNAQMDELEAKREQIRQEKLEEKKQLDELMEQFDAKQKIVSNKNLQYSQDLLDMIATKQSQRESENRERNEMHRQLIADIARMEAEDKQLALERKHAFHQATLDYIAYVKRMKQFEEQQQRMADERIQDLRRIDMCTKNNLLIEKERRAKRAEDCYAQLRKQICEQYERRLREQAELKECKILENRFAHEEITREQILERRRKNREDLDQQIAELKRIREEEEKKFHNVLLSARNDPAKCDALAKEYIEQGIDYLEPHANWRRLLCPDKHYVSKPPAKDVSELPGQRLTGDTCIRPCGCAIRGKFDCPHFLRDGRGDEYAWSS